MKKSIALLDKKCQWVIEPNGRNTLRSKLALLNIALNKRKTHKNFTQFLNYRVCKL